MGEEGITKLLYECTECKYQGKFIIKKEFIPWYLFLFSPFLAGWSRGIGLKFYKTQCPKCKKSYEVNQLEFKD